MEVNENKPIYNMLKKLGEGSYGKAYLVENPKDKNIYVIKTVYLDKMSEDEIKDALLEARILEKLDHPNIIHFKDSFLMRKPKMSLCIVMDFADGKEYHDLGGDLKKRITNQKGRFFSENQIIDWFTQICLAIKHIHDRKILHRDIKSQNVFLTKNGLIKLGDFGIAKCLDTTLQQAKTFIGTPYYLSPEMVQNLPYSFKSDVWSIGILLYEMCALKMPFDGSSIADLSLKIIKGIYAPIPNNFSKELKMLVNNLLNINPNKRPSISDILKLPLIKSRIKNFLSDYEYNDEFSHTILHKYNPLKNPKYVAKPGTGGNNEKKDEKFVNNYVQKPIIQQDKKENFDAKKRNIIDHSKKPTSSPSKLIDKKNISNELNKAGEEKKFSDILKDIDKKVAVDQPEKLSQLKNQYLEKYKLNLEKKDIKDYYNAHKMMIELDKIQKDEEDSSKSEDNIEDMKKNIDIKTSVNENYLGNDGKYEEELTNCSEKETNLNDTDNSKFQEMRKNIEEQLGEKLLNHVLKIIDEIIPKDSFSYDHEKISNAFIKMKGYDLKFILICIEKIPELYSLVIKEREHKLKK